MQAKEQQKKAEKEKNSISEKLLKTKEKYRSVKDEFKNLRYLNYELQKKLIGTKNIIDSTSLNVQCASNIINQQSNSISVIEPPSSPSLISPNVHVSPISKKKRPCNDILEQQTPKLRRNLDNTQIIEDTQNLSFETPGIKDLQAHTDFFLSDDIIESSSLGCRNRKKVDKVFIKNLSVNLFGKDILRNSSVTGRKPPTGGKPARPALPKGGIVYIQKLLQKRILNELNLQKDLPDEIKQSLVEQRSSIVIITQAIGDKITTLRR